MIPKEQWPELARRLDGVDQPYSHQVDLVDEPGDDIEYEDDDDW